MSAWIAADHPLAVAATEAVQSGDIAALRAMLVEHPHLATARIGDIDGMSRTLLHAATDWPGHFPNVVATIGTLIAAGADVNARFAGPHTETPLHWAASSDDVDALDALLDAGADIEADGAVIAGGTPLADATAFGQWVVARRLVERGAESNLFQSAVLGLMDRLLPQLDQASPDDITGALWGACHGGQLAAAQLLRERGGDIGWVSTWDSTTPLDAARRSDAAGAADVVAWLDSLASPQG